MKEELLKKIILGIGCLALLVTLLSGYNPNRHIIKPMEDMPHIGFNIQSDNVRNL